MIDSTEINVITKIVNKFFLSFGKNKIMINNSAIKIKKAVLSPLNRIK